MGWIDYLRVLRHRWKGVAAAVLLALIAAWVTTSVAPIGLGSSAPLYRATTVLINTGSLDALFLNNFQTAAALTTVGEVPRRVAAKLDTSESPVSLAGKIEAAVDAETAVLRISATSPEQKQAETMADTFATELIGYLAD